MFSLLSADEKKKIEDELVGKKILFRKKNLTEVISACWFVLQVV